MVFGVGCVSRRRVRRNDSRWSVTSIGLLVVRSISRNKPLIRSIVQHRASTVSLETDSPGTALSTPVCDVMWCDTCLTHKRLKGVKRYRSLCTWVTCHPTQVNAPVTRQNRERYNYAPHLIQARSTYPGGWKAELTWVTGYIPRWFTRPSINRVWHRATMLIKTNALPLSQPPPPLDLATPIPSTVQSSFDLLVSVLSSYPLWHWAFIFDLLHLIHGRCLCPRSH